MGRCYSSRVPLGLAASLVGAVISCDDGKRSATAVGNDVASLGDSAPRRDVSFDAVATDFAVDGEVSVDADVDMRVVVPCSETWTVETVVEVDLFRDFLSLDEAMLASGPFGETQIVWLDRQKREIQLARRTSSGWAAETVASVDPIDDSANMGLVIDDSGATHVAFFVGGPTLQYATNASGSWTLTDVASGDIKGFYNFRVAMRLDPAGRPTLFWSGASALWSAVPGEEPQVLFERRDVEGFSIHHHGVTYDDDGVMHLAFFGAGFDAVYATVDGDERNWEILDPGNDTGMFASVALAGGGEPHVTYTNASWAQTWHLRRDGGWPMPPFEATWYLKAPSMLAGPGGRLFVAGIADGDGPRLLTWQGGSWESESIDGGDLAARETILAVDSVGTLAVLWWDEDGKRLRVAQRCARD